MYSMILSENHKNRVFQPFSRRLKTHNRFGHNCLICVENNHIGFVHN